MGTFVIRPTVQSSGGTPYTNGAVFGGPDFIPLLTTGWYTDNATQTLLERLRNQDGVGAVGAAASNGIPFNDTLRFAFNGNSIYLDGATTPIQFNGMTSLIPTTCRIQTGLPAHIVGGSHFRIQSNSSTEGNQDEEFYDYNFTPGFNPSMFAIWANGMGIRVACPAGLPSGIINFGTAEVVGSYNTSGIISYVSSTTGVPVVNGSRVTISAPAGGLGAVQSLTVEYINAIGEVETVVIPPENIVEHTEFIIIFILIINPGETPATVVVNGIGTIFGGIVTLGIIPTIFFTAGSGIYRVVNGKVNDTVYITDSGGDTIDITIPRPFAKTGYIGG